MTQITSKTARDIITALTPLIEAKGLTANHLGFIMSQHIGGSDAQGSWNWRQAYDLMQASAVAVVSNAINELRKHGATDQQVLLMIEDMTSALPTETRRSERQMMLQQFSTPLTYSWVALCAAKLDHNDFVLEPSAGTGAFSSMANTVFGSNIAANELDPLRATILKLSGAGGVTSHDAEFIDDLLPASVKPSVVVMNPPFASSQSRSADPSIAMRHVISAAKRLKHGGRLVAIIPPSVSIERQEGLWGRLSRHVTPVLRLKLPRSAFAKLGTTIETHILVADKGVDPQTNCPEFDCSSVLRALEIIQTQVPTRQIIEQSAVKSSDHANIETPVTGKGGITHRPQRMAAPRRPLLRKTGLLLGAKPVQGTGAKPLDISLFDQPRVNAPISDVYAAYKPQRFSIASAQEHPTPLVESVAMGSVAPPLPMEIPVSLPERLLNTGALSVAQLETVVMAETSFAKNIPGFYMRDEDNRLVRDDAAQGATPIRQGYFLGDGTGCGKGRQVAGVILAGWINGQKRAVWLSKTSTLIHDAKRDWEDLGGAPTDIHALSKWKPDEDISLQNGILFLTYATLRSISKTGRKRLDQVLDWLGADFEGVVAFDEAHAMQNAGGGESGRGQTAPSQQGLAGLQLQDALPRARVFYVSATGATTVSNLAYATRLGLWGQGEEYAFASRESFVSEMEAGGVAAMEVVARDLKAMGLYTARALSFDGVEYDVMEHALSEDQITIYDTYADAFKVIHSNLHRALEATGITNADGASEQGTSARKSSVMSVFESTKQRFFSHLLQGLKAPSVIEAIKTDIENGWAPVVQIVSTGEALLKRRLDALTLGDDLTEHMFTPKEYVIGYLENAFPIHQQQLVDQPDGSTIAMPLLDDDGRPVVSREALALRDAAIEDILCVAPVPSALDQIIWALGTDNVAEVTGRSQRVVKSKDGRLNVERRSASSNLSETDAFMSGDKDVLIFSDAGGTGRSYQAAATAKNQNRRRHYLLEPGWRADNAIQGLGRTHRAAQVSAPFFRVCTTDVHGEKRFTSTIARRLDTLGALTKGQRDTASQGMFREEDNLESPIARGSLRAFFADMVNGTTTSIDLDAFCEWSGLELTGQDGIILDELPPIQRFLNRALAMPIAMQNAIFTEFMEKIAIATDRARQAGTLDVGLETLRGDRIVASPAETLRTCPNTGAKTSIVPLKIDKTLSYHSAKSALAIHGDTVPMRNSVSGKVALISRRPRQVYDDGVLSLERRIVRPNSVKYIDEDSFAKTNWETCDKSTFATLWDEEVEALPTHETVLIYLLTGLILPVWRDIPGKSARIYRAQPEEGPALLGRALSEDQVIQLRSKFMTINTDTPEDILNAVRHAGMIVEIGNDLELMQRTVAGQKRLEISGASSQTMRWLKTLGCFTEIHQFQLRLFIPNTLDDVPVQIIKQIQGGGSDRSAAPIDARVKTFSSAHSNNVAA